MVWFICGIWWIVIRRNIAVHRHPFLCNKTIGTPIFDGWWWFTWRREWMDQETGLINHIDYMLFLFIYTSWGNVQPYKHIYINWCYYMITAYWLMILMMSHEQQGVSYHQQLDCCFNSFFRRTSKLCITVPLWGNPLVSGGFPSQRTSNAEHIFMSWHCHIDWLIRCFVIQVIWQFLFIIF